jgi:hypothetical protein
MGACIFERSRHLRAACRLRREPRPGPAGGARAPEQAALGGRRGIRPDHLGGARPCGLGKGIEVARRERGCRRAYLRVLRLVEPGPKACRTLALPRSNFGCFIFSHVRRLNPSREPANGSLHGWDRRRAASRPGPLLASPDARPEASGRTSGGSRSRRERVEARSDRHAGVANVPPKRLDLRVRLRQFARDNGIIREPGSGAQRARGLYRHPTASASLR